VSRYETYQETIAKARKVLDILAAIGVKKGATRLHSHVANIEKVDSALARNGLRDAFAGASYCELQERLIWAVVETTELGEMLPGLLLYPDKGLLRKKLALALKGHSDPLRETSRSNLGRNTMFELNLECRLLHGGVSLCTVDQCHDIVCVIDGNELHIQCKRPFSAETVSKNIEVARAQLTRDLNSSSHPMPRGVIAISLSRVLNKGRRIFEAPSVERMADFRSRIISETDKYYGNGFVDSRIIAILFHVVTPALIKANIHPLTTAQQIVIRNYVPTLDFVTCLPTRDGVLIDRLGAVVAHSGEGVDVGMRI
jgi:hypothetical protein